MISALTGPALSIWLKPYFDLLRFISSWLFSVEMKGWSVGVYVCVVCVGMEESLAATWPEVRRIAFLNV